MFLVRWQLVAVSVVVGCGGDSDPTCAAVDDMVELSVVADTYIDGSATPHGDEGVLQLGAASTTLLRFRLGPQLRAPDLKFTLVLTMPATADDCGAGCGACPAMGASSGVTVKLVRSDWDEPTATTDLRDPATPWSMPGPSGVDTVPLAATSATAAGATLSIGFNALGLSLNAAWPVEEVSVLVSATSSETRYSSRSNHCEPDSAPRLVATCTASAL